MKVPTLLGFDLDNTIIFYGGLFHRLALERGLIEEADYPRQKNAIRDFIRDAHSDTVWQELQSLAYGPRLDEAELFPGVRQAFQSWRRRGLRLAIISHKTARSVHGNYDLRRAALGFLIKKAIMSLVDEVYFVNSIEAKINLIGQKTCRIFVDDLLEVLTHDDFPPGTDKILFSPENNYPFPGGLICADWAQVRAVTEVILGRR